MAIKKQISTNDVFEALYLRQADPQAEMTVDKTGSKTEWAFSVSERISRAIGEIEAGTAAIKVQGAGDLLSKKLGVVLPVGEPEAQTRAVGQRTKFTDEMKREALALKRQGLKMAEIQRELEKKHGGPAYQTLVKFFSDQE